MPQLNVQPQANNKKRFCFFFYLTPTKDCRMEGNITYQFERLLFKCSTEEDQRSKWIMQLRMKKPDNVVATALAAKLVRTAWVSMTSEEAYQETYKALTAAIF